MSSIRVALSLLSCSAAGIAISGGVGAPFVALVGCAALAAALTNAVRPAPRRDVVPVRVEDRPRP